MSEHEIRIVCGNGLCDVKHGIPSGILTIDACGGHSTKDVLNPLEPVDMLCYTAREN